MIDTSNNTPVKPKPQARKSAQDSSANEPVVLEEIQRALSVLKPLTDFHQAVEDAHENDCRLFWEVRLVRGKDTPLKYIHGTSSLPSILAPKMLPHAPTRLETEVSDKITGPLVEFFMTYAEGVTSERLARLRKENGFATGEQRPMEPHGGLRKEEDSEYRSPSSP